MYKEWKAEVLHRSGAALGEGPVWLPETESVLFVDIEGRKVRNVSLRSGSSQTWHMSSAVGMAAPAGAAKLILALEHALVAFNHETGWRQVLADVETDKPDNRCNDGKCDALGRLWFGTMDTKGKRGQGALYRYDGRLTKMLDGVSVSNGICWSPGNSTMYYIDSMDYNIKAFDFDLLTGRLGAMRIVAGTDYIPDGMCMDKDGMLWVAMWGGGCVHRYDPKTGQLTGLVKVDAPQVTSCAFGGSGMDQLLITTARSGLTDTQLRQFPDSGSLFIVDLPVEGMAAHSFTTTTLCI